MRISCFLRAKERFALSFWAYKGEKQGEEFEVFSSTASLKKSKLLFRSFCKKWQERTSDSLLSLFLKEGQEQKSEERKSKFPTLHFAPTELHFAPTELHFTPIELNSAPTDIHFASTELHFTPTVIAFLS